MIRISEVEFERAVQVALDSIPEEFEAYMENVIIEVMAAPTPVIMRDHDVPDDVLGLYVGVPLDERGDGGFGSTMPDRIFIFRDNLCAMCKTYDELIEEIRITVLHEIGHHFGMDEDDLDDVGYA